MARRGPPSGALRHVMAVAAVTTQEALTGQMVLVPAKDRPATPGRTSGRAQARLHHRYRSYHSLVGRVGVNKTVVAVAPKLAGFVWPTGQPVSPARRPDRCWWAWPSGPASIENPRYEPCDRKLAPLVRGTWVTGSLSCGNGSADPPMSE